jgi:hypothetical protein
VAGITLINNDYKLTAMAKKNKIISFEPREITSVAAPKAKKAPLQKLEQVNLTVDGQIYDLTTGIAPTPDELPDGCVAIGEVDNWHMLYKNRGGVVIAIKLEEIITNYVLYGADDDPDTWLKARITTPQDFDALSNNLPETYTIYIGGEPIVKNTIREVHIITTPPSNAYSGTIPANFCHNFTALTYIDLTGLSGVTAIGSSFMDSCSAFNPTNGTLVLPANLLTIGSYFMRSCSAFNPTNGFELPAGVTTIGNYFMGYCSAFNPTNGTLVLPANLLTIGSYFMYSCSAFNPTNGLTIPDGVTAISDYFMRECTAFNPTNGFEIPAGVTAIGTYFMCGCTAFNPTNGTLTLPANLLTIGTYFMAECTAFNPTNGFEIPAGVTTIGNSFMAECRNCTTTITFNSIPTLTSSAYSLATTTAGQPLGNPGVTVTGVGADAAKAAWPNSDVSPFRKLTKI